MKLKLRTVAFLILSGCIAAFASCARSQQLNTLRYDSTIVVGAERIAEYLPLIQSGRVGIVANQTSLVKGVHLVDTLLSLNIDVKKVFAPEHGFRGHAAAGESIKSERDIITGLPVISLYGEHKRPTLKDLEDIDIIIFDIQDVGARFYTYISTMHLVMDAAAEFNKKVLILDRPNPNGFYVDGPVLEMEYQSFVGMHPIPIVHGLTVGELANMINGENWLSDNRQCTLTVIPCENYEHTDLYRLPVKPSPNLPNMESIYLYPSLCLLEPTKISVGRGTDKPFQVIGYPENTHGNFEFIPIEISGVANSPKYEGELCKGSDLQDFGGFYFFSSRQLYLEWIVRLYETYPHQEEFFTSETFFDKLAGNDLLKQQIKAEKSVNEIRESWEPKLSKYKIARKKYLIYPDFQ